MHNSLSSILLTVCLISILSLSLLSFSPSVSAYDWLSGYSYRKKISITGSSGAGANYQILFTVCYGSGSDSGSTIYLNNLSQTDFDDVRFTDNDESTVLNLWIQSKIDSNHVMIWVKVSDSLDSNVDIYIYYGNPSAVSMSNPDSTLIYYNDFENVTVGQPPEKFQETTSLTVVSSSGEGIKCLKFAVSGTGAFHRMSMESVTNFKMDAMMCNNNTNYQSSYFIRYANSTAFILVGGVYGNPANYWAMANNTITLNYTAFTWGNQWRNVSIWASGNYISSTIDTTTRTYNNDNQMSGVCGVRDWNSVTGYFDYIRIRRYIDPEPTVSSSGSVEFPKVWVDVSKWFLSLNTRQWLNIFWYVTLNIRAWNNAYWFLGVNARQWLEIPFNLTVLGKDWFNIPFTLIVLSKGWFDIFFWIWLDASPYAWNDIPFYIDLLTRNWVSFPILLWSFIAGAGAFVFDSNLVYILLFIGFLLVSLIGLKSKRGH